MLKFGEVAMLTVCVKRMWMHSMPTLERSGACPTENFKSCTLRVNLRAFLVVNSASKQTYIRVEVFMS